MTPERQRIDQLFDEALSLKADQRAAFAESAGYSQPARYGDPAAEYRAAVNGVALFDASHAAKLQLTGPDAPQFLHNISTNDIAKAPSTITVAPATGTFGETPSQPGTAGERNQGNEATPPLPNPQMTTPQQRRPTQPLQQPKPQGGTPR